LAGIKLVSPAIFFQLSFVHTYCREDRATHGFVPIIWYQISGCHGRFHPHTIHSFIIVSSSPFCVLRSATIVHKIAKKLQNLYVVLLVLCHFCRFVIGHHICLCRVKFFSTLVDVLEKKVKDQKESAKKKELQKEKKVR
jgi:hypothetical protein